MEGSFSPDKRHYPQQTVPHRNQFAPARADSVDFSDPEQRRRYVNEQVAAHVPLKARLQRIQKEEALRKDQAEEAVHLEEQRRYWQDLLEEGDRNEGVYEDILRSVQAHRLEEEARHGGRIEAAVERQNGTPLRLRDSADRRKLSEGKYRDQGKPVGGTRGEVQRHVDRLRLGQYKALERLDAELRELADRRAHLRKTVPPLDGSWSKREARTYRAANTELDQLEESLNELRAPLEGTATDHAYGIVDAARAHSLRSHVPKPIKPRGDGLSIRDRMLPEARASEVNVSELNKPSQPEHPDKPNIEEWKRWIDRAHAQEQAERHEADEALTDEWYLDQDLLSRATEDSARQDAQLSNVDILEEPRLSRPQQEGFGRGLFNDPKKFDRSEYGQRKWGGSYGDLAVRPYARRIQAHLPEKSWDEQLLDGSRQGYATRFERYEDDLGKAYDRGYEHHRGKGVKPPRSRGTGESIRTPEEK